MKTKCIFRHPIRVLGYRGPSDYNSLISDTKCYGFDLDLTTCAYYYKYDWGYGFIFRVLGFGVHMGTQYE